MFKFQGKSGVRHAVAITDRRLARIIQRCQDIPRYELFQYVDSDGQHHTIDSADVNDYLRTAKDFRTWAGTVLACTRLYDFNVFESETEAKKNVVEIVKAVAARLGNTPPVCRKCYIHPAVIDTYMNGGFAKTLREHEAEESLKDLQPEETILMKLMQRVLRLTAITTAAKSSQFQGGMDPNLSSQHQGRNSPEGRLETTSSSSEKKIDDNQR